MGTFLKVRKNHSRSIHLLAYREGLKQQNRIKQSVNSQGKPCQTYFSEKEKIGDFSLVEVRPITGRTHQIRVHAAHIGLAVLGDKLYGLPEEVLFAG
ncbi:MAG: hypothetical protein CM1200mP28_16330 [Deltaproteobacteria bacterium]|nr:MAG: hypothetical protein CM1200mP28_16330 [Deltaproteobacteria bacterium]